MIGKTEMINKIFRGDVLDALKQIESESVDCGSAGHVSQEAVKRYIQEQEGKDVFEYSVFGSPQQKIGNFTQTKLGVF